MPLVEVNHCQPILHMSKRMVHCYTRYETINQFAIGYMIAPSLQKFLSILFDAGTMETIKYFMRQNNTCVMALMIIYENNGEIQKTFYRVFSCVVYSII